MKTEEIATEGDGFYQSPGDWRVSSRDGFLRVFAEGCQASLTDDAATLKWTAGGNRWLCCPANFAEGGRESALAVRLETKVLFAR